MITIYKDKINYFKFRKGMIGELKLDEALKRAKNH